MVNTPTSQERPPKSLSTVNRDGERASSRLPRAGGGGNFPDRLSELFSANEGYSATRQCFLRHIRPSDNRFCDFRFHEPPYAEHPVRVAGVPRVVCSKRGQSIHFALSASSGSSPPPPTCSPQAGQCSGTWSPPVAVSRPCQRAQAAKFSNRRAGLNADTVIRRGWC